MSDVQIRVEGTPEDLEQLRRDLQDAMAGEARIQPVSSSAPGELREPVLVALVIALAPVAIDNLRRTIERYLEHRETIEELRLYRDGGQEVAVEELGPKG